MRENRIACVMCPKLPLDGKRYCYTHMVSKDIPPCESCHERLAISRRFKYCEVCRDQRRKNYARMVAVDEPVERSYHGYVKEWTALTKKARPVIRPDIHKRFARIMSAAMAKPLPTYSGREIDVPEPASMSV